MKPEIYLKKGLEIRENIVGENHLLIAESKNYLGEVYLNIGDYSKAEKYYDQALDIRFKRYGRLNRHTAEDLNNLASIYYQLGNKTEPIQLYKKY